MLTLFSTAKPFTGHSDIIQRNALQSWRLLHPDVEIILFGDDRGAAKVCRELGLRHEPRVERAPEGPPYMRSVFDRARQIARHDLVCYANCDIVFTRDLVRALGIVSGWQQQFLMVGRRWDLDVAGPLDFSQANWQDAILQRAHAEGYQRLYYNIDYFAFRRGLYRDIPDLVIARNWWDQWLVWRAGDLGAPVVDASDVVCAVHQNHDYSYHPQGMEGLWYGEGARRNFEIAGGKRHLHTIEDADFRLTAQGIEPNRLYWLAPTKRVLRERVATLRRFVRLRFWHPLLEVSRPVRHALGLRRRALPGAASRSEQQRLHPFDRTWTPSIQWDRKTDEKTDDKR